MPYSANAAGPHEQTSPRVGIVAANGSDNEPTIEERLKGGLANLIGRFQPQLPCARFRYAGDTPPGSRDSSLVACAAAHGMLVSLGKRTESVSVIAEGC